MHDNGKERVMRCVDCEYLKRIQKPIRFGKDIYDTGMVECTKHDLIMEYTSTRALNKRTCVEEQTDCQWK